jgi:hypothetical protein
MIQSKFRAQPLVQIPSQVIQQSPSRTAVCWCQNGRLHEEGEEEDDAGLNPQRLRDLVTQSFDSGKQVLIAL